MEERRRCSRHHSTLNCLIKISHCFNLLDRPLTTTKRVWTIVGRIERSREEEVSVYVNVCGLPAVLGRLRSVVISI